MERITPVVLAVGTTHPLNIAGVGLDLRIAGQLGVRVVTVVAGISAQSADAVLARLPVDDRTIAAQFAGLAGSGVRAVHVGALLDAHSVLAVARELERFSDVPIVCDPVLAASNGGRLADDATVAALRDRLFARCLLITPNLDEAALILGRPLSDLAAMEAGALAMLEYGAAAVLIKGGHLAGEPTDVLVGSGGHRRFSAPRLAATLRGTGDLLAAAIAARLAHGDGLVASIEAARALVRAALVAGVPFAGSRTLP